MSFGDCLYATTIARQIKKDYPDCHLTWAIGSMCRSVVDGNPYIDDIWEIPLHSSAKKAETWFLFKEDAKQRKKRGDFDEVFFTQIDPENLQNYDGAVRSSIFRAYPHPITVPISPIMRLSPEEISHVQRFAKTHRLSDMKQVVLFECSPKSGQSPLTPAFAAEVSQKLISYHPDMAIILSSDLSIQTDDRRIIDGSVLSFRENAALTNYCTLLIGCSSGISWLCTSDMCKPLPMVQLISSKAQWFASFIHDFQYWGLDVEHIIEMSDCPAEGLFACVNTIIVHGFKQAKTEFHQKIAVSFTGFRRILITLLDDNAYKKAHGFVRMYFKKYGLNPNLFLNLLYGLWRHASRRCLSRLKI